MNKVLNFNSLSEIRKKYKNQKIVLCHGVFDILHHGHINHFTKSKSYGDILVVSLTEDKFIKKGSNRPYFNIHNRIKVLKNLDVIDFVVISEFETAKEIINKLKPNIYCKGIEYKKKDYTGNIKKELFELRKNKGKIKYTNEETSSSSKIINDLFSTLPKENRNFINEIKTSYNIQEIEKIFNNIKNKKILVIGEIIIDQISNCSVVGKSSKDMHLIARELNTKKYLGGTASITNYISEFCNVTLLSIVGKDYKNYNIHKNLNKNVKREIYVENKGQTILKKRYTDIESNAKLFGNYNAENCVISKKNEDKVIRFIKKESKKFDKIILCDYNHNFITKKILKSLENKNIILNSQINAHNFGFHSYSKYKNINFLVANEKEIRHDLHDANSSIDILIKNFLKKNNFKNLVISRGGSGLIYYSKKLRKKINYPAFGVEVKDKVGAGDTLLSFISIFFNEKSSNNHLCFFIASIAAAENIKNYVNSTIINKNSLLKKIMHLIS
jgi:rfaE bifunctional protein nucleotidyltransferase chain/domain